MKLHLHITLPLLLALIMSSTAFADGWQEIYKKCSATAERVKHRKGEPSSDLPENPCETLQNECDEMQVECSRGGVLCKLKQIRTENKIEFCETWLKIVE